MLSFVALLAYAAGYKASTTKECLMAIKFFHLAHEHDNPLEKLPRVFGRPVVLSSGIRGPLSVSIDHPKNV